MTSGSTTYNLGSDGSMTVTTSRGGTTVYPGSAPYMGYLNTFSTALYGGGSILPPAANGAVLAGYGIHVTTGGSTPSVSPSTGSAASQATSIPQTQTSGGGQGMRPPTPVGGPSGFCSFTPDTQVTTSHGHQPIGKLHVGNKVLAYNPKTQKMELEPILHVWIHQDHDLVDLTITSTTKAHHGTASTKKSEVVRTTSEHPFLTTEQGFVPTGKLKLGMHVLRADGSVGVVTGWKSVPGTKVMYNLEVAHDHTFTVGDGQWVVHNSCSPQDRRDLRNSLQAAGELPGNVDTQAHHLIPCQFQQDPLVASAIAGGFGFNTASNGIALPTNMEGSNLLSLPFQNGSHPAYNKEIGNQLRAARTDLEAQYGSLDDVPNEVAAQTVQDIANGARATLEGAGGGGCINDVF